MYISKREFFSKHLDVWVHREVQILMYHLKKKEVLDIVTKDGKTVYVTRLNTVGFKYNLCD